MQAFQKHKGIVAVLNRRDVDTDQIIPKQFLKKIERSGFGAYLFYDWRFSDAEGKKLNPKFELNQKRYDGASILITGENFGCGSSREHAPWALEDYGFRIIIAPSFADIFYNNCINTGILPVCLSTKAVQEIIAWLQEANNGQATSIVVDLREQTLRAGDQDYSFEIASDHKQSLLEGKDQIDLSLQHLDRIKSFEDQHFARFPFYKIAKTS